MNSVKMKICTDVVQFTKERTSGYSKKCPSYYTAFVFMAIEMYGVFLEGLKSPGFDIKYGIC